MAQILWKYIWFVIPPGKTAKNQRKIVPTPSFWIEPVHDNNCESTFLLISETPPSILVPMIEDMKDIAIAAYYGVPQEEGHRLRVEREGRFAVEEASERVAE